MKPSLQQEIIQNSNTTTTTKPCSNTKQQEQEQEQQAGLGVQKCPRCDSSNTKFCYYNNYSLTQPRHFCKTCRRYWTKGGALRNVPIGGGCRKTKKLKSSSSSSSSSNYSNSNSNSNSSTNNFKFFAGISPSIDFGFGLSPSPLLNISPSSNFSLDHHHHHHQYQNPTTNNNNNNNYPIFMGSGLNLDTQQLAISSIESLSSLNQDLHWKLQQHRLATMFVDHHHNHHQVQNFDDQNHKLLQPILFHNLDQAPKHDTTNCFNNINHVLPAAAGKDQSVAAADQDQDVTNTTTTTTTTEWFFGNNNSLDHNHLQVSAARNDIDHHGGTGWSDDNDTNGVQPSWEDHLHHFTALP